MIRQQFKLKRYGHVRLEDNNSVPISIGKVSSDSLLSAHFVTMSLIGDLSRQEFADLTDRAEVIIDRSVRHPSILKNKKGVQIQGKRYTRAAYRDERIRKG